MEQELKYPLGGGANHFALNRSSGYVEVHRPHEDRWKLVAD